MQDISTAIAVIVVVYNKFCGDSPTCQGLLQSNNFQFRTVVYDNSTNNYSNLEFCKEKNWIYIDGHGNKGLSVAYNQAIVRLLEEGFNGIVCLFDDDTYVESKYLDAVRRADWSCNNIYVPIVYSGEMIVSPCVYKKNYDSCGFFINEAQVRSYNGNDLSAINSGMAIRISLFEDYRYDEKVFLECIDHKFLRDMKARGEHIGLLDYRCNHDFSGLSKVSKSSALVRFRIYAKDLRYLLQKQHFAYLWIAGKRMQYLVRTYRSFDFLKIYIRTFFDCDV